MKLLSAIWFSLSSLLRRTAADADLDEEMRFHLEREALLLERDGLSPSDARHEARRRFGGVERYREECRDVRRVSWWTDFRTDARFALRLAQRNPGFAVNVVLISALGITACVTTFSLVSGILLAPLPFPDSDRVFHLQLRASGVETAAVPTPMYLQLAKGSQALEGIAVGESALGITQINGETVGLPSFRVTPSFFRVYRLRPEAGRFFDEAEVTARTPVVVLGHEEWRTRYGGDPSVIGRQLSINEVPHTVVGVMPPRFRAHSDAPRALWLPILPDPARKRTVNVVVRLADGVSPERAEAILHATARARVQGEGRDSATASASLIPAADLVYGQVRRPLVILFGAVLLVIVLVAANIATMFLTQSSARAQELGVRRALGAGAGRQVRQLITESLTLTALGGLLGIAVSAAVIKIIRSLGVGLLPPIDQVSLDWRVGLFAVAVVILVGCVGGLTQALGHRRDRPLGDASGDRVSSQKASSALVVAQVALSLVLLVGAGLLVKGFMKVAPTNPGFELENRAMVRVSIRGTGRPDPAEHLSFVRAMAVRMRAVPGVTDVATTSVLPLTGMMSLTQVEAVGGFGPDPAVNANEDAVSENFFSVMAMPIRRGRAFTPTDRATADPVVVISETAAARWFAGDPIGLQLATGSGDQRVVRTVVGVVGDVRLTGTDTRLRSQIYVPMEQGHAGLATFIAATSVDPATVLPALRRSVAAVAPRSLIDDASTLSAKAIASVSRTRFFSVTMGMFALAATLLSALGVYALLSVVVAQRTREIGIRLALGATAARIGGLVLGRAVAIGLTGTAIGFLLARGLSRYLEAVLLEVTATDQGVFAIASVAVFAIAVLAACAPAYRAVRVDPIRSLRS